MFWNLLFAHLVGDYPLQSEWLIEKKRTMWGLSLHISIHLALMLLVVGSAVGEVWPKIILLIFIHFLLDFTKSSLAVRWPKHEALQYVVDQSIHILSIFLVSRWIESSLDPGVMPENAIWLIYASGYLLVTYVWYITERMFVAGDPVYLHEMEEQFWHRMIARAALLTVFLFAGGELKSLFTGMTLQLPYLTGSRRQRALVTDVLVALVMAVLIGFVS
jgi:hypothetical protein